MIRAVLYALISIVAITFIRMVVGIITRGFSDMMKEEGAAARNTASTSGKATDVPKAGVLKACATCGTYVVASQAVVATVKGEPAYYCSAKCKESATA
jgi:hypothetical protein